MQLIRDVNFITGDKKLLVQGFNLKGGQSFNHSKLKKMPNSITDRRTNRWAQVMVIKAVALIASLRDGWCALCQCLGSLTLEVRSSDN